MKNLKLFTYPEVIDSLKQKKLENDQLRKFRRGNSNSRWKSCANVRANKNKHLQFSVSHQLVPTFSSLIHPQTSFLVDLAPLPSADNETVCSMPQFGATYTQSCLSCLLCEIFIIGFSGKLLAIHASATLRVITVSLIVRNRAAFRSHFFRHISGARNFRALNASPTRTRETHYQGK
jgi:hypothetical protein